MSATKVGETFQEKNGEQVSVMNGFSQRMHKFFAYYRLASRNRGTWLNVKWRLFVVLLLASFMLVVRDYLSGKYVAELVANPGSFLVADTVLNKVFYWFFVGIIAGAFASWLIFEGEYALGVYKTATAMEHDAIRRLQEMTQVRSTRSPANARQKKKRR